MTINLIKKYLLALVIIFLIIPKANAETKDQQVKVLLRSIGNEFLLQLTDSTTRVLPIKKVGGRYEVKFERNFSFEPDLLFFSVFKTFEEMNISDGYLIEVEECESKELVHSFVANLKSIDEKIACKKRLLPEECYVFYFTLVTDKDKMGGVVENKTSRIGWFVFPLFLGLIVFIVLKYRKKSEEEDLDVINIGNYLFNKKEMNLSINDQTTELSSKECDLLYLLFSNENKTLERDYIQQEIWQDEGKYVGRTLDVFISKLRKKLEGDEQVKIVNVRGVGYKMVVS